MNKISILLIAGFSNNEIRTHLSLRKGSIIVNYLIKMFHLPARIWEFTDYAPWVVSMIRAFEERNDIELHVASPHVRLQKPMEVFDMRGVHYYFFRSEFSSFARLIKNYHIWRNLQQSGKYTKKILKKIQPDIVILSGAENPVVSVSILYAEKYPRLCLCQTIYSDVNTFKSPDKLKVALEKAIFDDVPNIGVYCKKHYYLLREIVGENKYIFKYNYPSKGNYKEPIECEKKYDFVNFAFSHNEGKGTFDSVRALAIVKKIRPTVKLNIVGGCDSNVKRKLDDLIDEYGLRENVIFTPLFENRKDLFMHVQQSRFALLPSKIDNISGTMLQSMVLGLPLIVYSTMGTQSFNHERECALIADMGNVEQLAEHMNTLLKNPEKGNVLRANGRWYKEQRSIIARKNWNRLVNSLRSIIDNYHEGTPVCSEGLFDVNQDD